MTCRRPFSSATALSTLRRAAPGAAVPVLVLAMATPAFARPNLVVTKLANGPATLPVGGSFAAADTVANRSRDRAGASETRFYLSPDARASLADRRTSRTDPRTSARDLLLIGSRRIGALSAGGSSAAPRRPKTIVRVPFGTSPGTYDLLACADDRGSVREAREEDNCRAARRKVRVTGTDGGLRLDAFSDTFVQPPLSAEDLTIGFQQRILCTPQPARRLPSLSAAVASARRILATKAGADAFPAFKRSAAYRSAAAAERAAAGAILLDKPGAALAAMLRAHDLEPREASHLVNAAGLATSIGLPNEALAMLDAAVKLDDRDAPPMAISRQAAALTNRAQALAALGRWREAIGAADAALAIEPLLSEAETVAGVAELCAGRKQPAIARIRKGRKRQPDKDPPVDDSAGKESSLPALPLPATPSQAVELVPFYRGQQSGRLAELQARVDREMAIRQRINSRPRANALTEKRRAQLLAAVSNAGNTPRLRAMSDEIGALFQKAHSWWQQKWCDGDSCDDEEWGQIRASCADLQSCVRSKCVPAAKEWHQGWLSDNTALYEKTQEYFRALSKRMSGIAAHIKDPDTYALALLAIEQQEDSLYFAAQQPAYYWSDWTRRAQSDCVEGFEPPPPTDGADPRAAQGPGPCPPLLKGINAIWDLGFAELKVNCDEIQVEGGIGSGWISAFGEVTYDARAGKITVFGGSKGTVGVPGLKGEFKSGLYITASQQGFEDFGWRVGPEYTVGGGPVEFTQSDTVDLSFVGTFAGTGG